MSDFKIGNSILAWQISFDENSQGYRNQNSTLSDAEISRLAREIVAAQPKITDLFIHAHGLNNSFSGQQDMVTNYYKVVEPVVPKDRTIGVCAVAWPSSFSDLETASIAAAGGAAAIGGFLLGFGLFSYFTGAAAAAAATRARYGAVFRKYMDRANELGERSFAPFLRKLTASLAQEAPKQSAPVPRIHLSGHSLGARFMSYSLKGLTDSSVQSLFLLQGALPARVFAQGEDLENQQRKVAGCIAATCTKSDDDLKGYAILETRAAMGWDGSEGIGAKTVRVHVAPFFRFSEHKFVDVDCNSLITGHNTFDFVEVARAHLAAAGLVSTREVGGRRCRIRNTTHNEYLFACANKMFDDSRRHVFTYRPGGPVPDGVWCVIDVGGGKCQFFNECHQEFLYVGGETLDGDRRHAFTWRPGNADDMCEWTLEPLGNETYRIFNTRRREYLYAADFNPYDDVRRRVLSWRPGGAVTQGDWKLEWL